MNETGTYEEEEELLDYFSRLPESVVHHILSLLPFKDVVRCSVLSKTWKRIWSNYPNIALELCARIFSDQQHPGRQFLDPIEGILEQCLFRKACMQKLQLSITSVSNLEEFAPNMDRWLGAAIERNVSELVLKIIYLRLDIFYSIPERVVVAHSLKVLEVAQCRFEDRFTCIELSHLQKLKLCACQFVGENVLNKILSGCPELEFLEVNCHGVGSFISISCNPRLKYFFIDGGTELKRIEIFAPILETFEYISRNSCVIHLASCTALKHLNLKQAYLSAHHLPPIQYLLSKALGIESLLLYNCEAVGQIKISSPCLKRLVIIYSAAPSSFPGAKICFPGAKIDSPNLLDLHFSVSVACNLDFKFSSWTVPKLEKVHMVFSVESFSTVYNGGLEDFLMKLHNYGSLKLLIAMAACEDELNLILHEKLLAVPFLTLNKFMIKGRTEYAAISSRREEDLLTNPLYSGRGPIRLSLICSSRQSIELLYKKLSKDENLQFNVQLISTAEIEHQMDSAWKSFMNTHSIGYETATIIFD